MADMHYQMRARFFEFGSRAKSHLPWCFALLDHPFAAVSPLESLCLHKLEKCAYLHSIVCICVRVWCIQNNRCSPEINVKGTKQHLLLVAPWSVFYFPKRNWPQIVTRKQFCIWFLTYHRCFTHKHVRARSHQGSTHMYARPCASIPNPNHPN